MKTPDKISLEVDSLIQRGLDPETVDNLLAHLDSWREIRSNITLEEIYYLEVDDTSVLDDPELEAEQGEDDMPVQDSPDDGKGEIPPAPEKDLGQIYRQAASALTLQNLEDSSAESNSEDCNRR